MATISVDLQRSGKPSPGALAARSSDVHRLIQPDVAALLAFSSRTPTQKHELEGLAAFYAQLDSEPVVSAQHVQAAIGMQVSMTDQEMRQEAPPAARAGQQAATVRAPGSFRQDALERALAITLAAQRLWGETAGRLSGLGARVGPWRLPLALTAAGLLCAWGAWMIVPAAVEAPPTPLPLEPPPITAMAEPARPASTPPAPELVQPTAASAAPSAAPAPARPHNRRRPHHTVPAAPAAPATAG